MQFMCDISVCVVGNVHGAMHKHRHENTPNVIIKLPKIVVSNGIIGQQQ